MKIRNSIFGLICLAGAIALISIMAFQFNPNQSRYEPILMTRAEMEASVVIYDAQPIESPGKIWIYNDFILLIEKYRGIHILDNSDPEALEVVAFIQVDGCTDLAMKDGIIYANNAVDIIAIDGKTNFGSIEVVSRNRNVLPMVASVEEWNDYYYINQLPSDMIIVRWIPNQD